jgi:hypothetical protein
MHTQSHTVTCILQDFYLKLSHGDAEIAKVARHRWLGHGLGHTGLDLSTQDSLTEPHHLMCMC